MDSLFFLIYGTAIIGLVLAIAYRAVRRHWALGDPLTPGARATSIIGASTVLLSVLIGITFSAGPLLGLPLIPLPQILMIQGGFALPLVAGLVAAIVMIFPTQRRSPRRETDFVRSTRIVPNDGHGGSLEAQLRRRTISDFSRRIWFILFGLIVLAIVITTLIAGFASSPDENGNSTMYLVSSGSSSLGTVAGTSIYGWHYSWIGLSLTALIVVITLISVTRIARPPLGDDPALDAARRQTRIGNTIAVASAALLFHLGTILVSLEAAATILGVTPTDIGPVRAESAFAALAGPLNLARDGVNVIAYAVLFSTLFGAIAPRDEPTAKAA